MTKVLGKVVNQKLDEPRGPDVVHRIRVPPSWLERGATIEFEVPRNLTCADCGGGGCDACERAGAITLRGREEPAELVQVTLPQKETGSQTARDVVLRIPGKGGLADSDLPRGMMMLRVSCSDEMDDRVWLSEPSLAPHADLEARKRASPEVVKRSLVVAAFLVIVFLLILKLSGWL